MLNSKHCIDTKNVKAYAKTVFILVFPIAMCTYNDTFLN